LRNTESDPKRDALSAALAILSRRDMSSAELVRRLTVKGFAGELAEETACRLHKAGYLDDRRFARRWAESAILNGRGFGPRLRFELARQLVPAEIASEVLASLAEEYDELETLSAILEKKFSGFDAASASDREKRRVMQYFQRRGFSTAAIFRLFRMGQTE
jgi:regulatory protein